MSTIKVLGPGCANCQRLTALTEQALKELDQPAEVEKITDYAQIAAYGVMSTPALVVDDRVVMSGRIPALASLKAVLAERLAPRREAHSSGIPLGSGVVSAPVRL
jgi:small redox-active disulfide protein 2